VRGNTVADTQALSEALRALPDDQKYRLWRRDLANTSTTTSTDNQIDSSCPNGGDTIISMFFKTRDDSNILTPTNIAKAKELQDKVRALPQTRGIYMSTISALADKPKDEFDRIVNVIASGVASGLREDFAGGAEYFYGQCRSYKYDWVEPGKVLCGIEYMSKTDHGSSLSLIGEQSVGCYEDAQERDLEVKFGSGKSPEECFRLVSEAGLTYAGLQYRSECYGGNDVGAYGRVLNTECNLPCDEDNLRICGGSYRNSVFVMPGNTDDYMLAPATSPEMESMDSKAESIENTDDGFWALETHTNIDDVKDMGVQSYFQRNFSLCHPSSSVVRVIVHACEQHSNETKQVMYDSWSNIGKMDKDIFLIWSDEDYFEYEQEQTIVNDSILIVAVAPLVFIAICVQTGSFFIATMGFLEIFISFGLANFFYRSVLGIDYFHFLNFLGLFILLGIGADDVFVITDAWKQAAIVHGDQELEKRMQATLKRACPSILATSVTTAAAFFGNMISNIPALRLFGMITGFMVIFDWLLTVTFLASALVIHARFLTKNKKVEKEIEQEEDNDGILIAADAAPIMEPNDIDNNKLIRSGDDTEKEKEQIVDGSAGKKAEWRRLEEFFEKSYVPWLVRNATAILIVAAVFVGIAANIAVRLEPEVGLPSLYPSWHNQYHEETLNFNVLPGEDFPVFMQVFYGTENGDGSKRLDPSDSQYGIVTYDKDFDLSRPQAQEFFLNTCEALNSEQNLVRRVTDCFMLQFRDYARDIYSGGSFPDGCDEHDGATYKKGIGFPVPADKFANAMQCFDQSSYKHRLGKYGLDADGNVQWAVIRAQTRLRTSATAAQIIKAYDDWKEFIDARNALGKNVGGLSDALFNDANYRFIGLNTITELQSGFLKATVLSLTLAFIIMLASTRHFLLALFALFSVFSIVLSMVALMKLLGYKLGVLESLALSILVGISIDYTLHLAIAYVGTPEKLSVEERMSRACKHSGISIISGAITTSLSGFVLIFSTTAFFTTFGLFILATALLSIVSALTIFASMCVLFLKKRNHDNEDETNSSNDSSSGSNRFPIRSCIAFFLILAVSVTSIAITVTNISKSEPLSKEIKTKEFTFPPHVLSEKKTHYLCSSFVIPKNMYVNSIEVIDGVDHPSIVHHMLVLSSLRDYGSCPTQCMDMPLVTGMKWVWAIGGGNLTLDSNQYMMFDGIIIVQIHYDNYLGRPISDAGSGIRVHYTEIQPTSSLSAVTNGKNNNDNTVSDIQVGTVGIGSSPEADWEIQPNTQNNTLMFETRIQLLNEVSVRGWALHMHETGVRGRLELYRDNQFVSFIGCVGYKDVYGTDPTGIHGCAPYKYLFDYQRYVEVPRESGVVIKPGDVLRQTCEMDTTNINETTRSGYGTHEEMCMTFVMVYPSGNLILPFVYTSKATLIVSDGNVLTDRRSLPA